MNEQTESSTSIKAGIESAEEHALGAEQHAQLEQKETVLHQYLPVPVELSIIALVILGLLYFVWKKFKRGPVIKNDGI
jgi:hypothetical protein